MVQRPCQKSIVAGEVIRDSEVYATQLHTTERRPFSSRQSLLQRRKCDPTDKHEASFDIDRKLKEPNMAYPVPLQIHVVWHPRSDARCRPIAERIYRLLNRDPFQPLVPGIGIPVFFRSAGGNPADSSSDPAPIVTSEVGCALSIFLLTSDFVLDDVWERFRASCAQDLKGHRDKAALISIFLEAGLAEGDAKAIVLDEKSARSSDLIVQHALLLACRVLAGRAREGDLAARGAAPLRLFLSHTKRDRMGLKIAEALKHYLDMTTVDRFFDEVSIQPGDSITRELEEGIEQSALVAIRTDGYVSSPWCRWELALAKRKHRPMVVVDALVESEPRSTPFLSNLASIRVEPDNVTQEHLDRIGNFIGLEVLRFLYVGRQLTMLKDAGIVPPGAMLLPRPPEARDLIVARQSGGAITDGGPIFVHPDPLLSKEETEDLASMGAVFKTPTSIWSKRLAGVRLGLSVSGGDKAEEAALGLSPLHLEDAAKVIARQALAAGATLVYGGALNANTLEAQNLTEALYEMIGAYNRSGNLGFAPLINYTPWPWHQEVETPWLAQRKSCLKLFACEPPEGIAASYGAGDGPGHVVRLAATPEGRYALARSLTSMRECLARETDARIVLGGKPVGFMGLLPGVVEEALFAIRREQPLYVVGGFGGAARLIAQALQGVRPGLLTKEQQVQLAPAYGEMLAVYGERRATDRTLPPVDYGLVTSELATYGVKGVSESNGLSIDENLELFQVASIDAALYLIMKGLAEKRRGAGDAQ
jgi:hypothetical protein